MTQNGSATKKGPKKSHLRRNVIIYLTALALWVVGVFWIASSVFYLCACGTPYAAVQVQPIQCFANNSTCSFIVVNDGNAAGTITGCSFSGWGQGVMSGQVTVQSGSQGHLSCTAPSGLVPIRGAAVTGFFATNYGPTIPFVAIWD